MKFDFDSFFNLSNEIWVQCKTQEIARDFLKSVQRRNPGSPANKNYEENWTIYAGNTCYSSHGGHAPYGFEAPPNIKIYDWSEYMKSAINYLDFEYIVVFRSGHTGIYLKTDDNGILYVNGTGTTLKVSSYDDNLCYIGNNGLDIMKIYGLPKDTISSLFDTEYRELIWEREEFPVLSEDDIFILKHISEEYQWIARNKDNTLTLHQKEPYYHGTWHSTDKSVCFPVIGFCNIPFNKEAYNIKEMIEKNERK